MSDRLSEALPYFEKAADLDYPKGAAYAVQIRQELGLNTTPQENPAQDVLDAFELLLFFSVCLLYRRCLLREFRFVDGHKMEVDAVDNNRVCP